MDKRSSHTITTIQSSNSSSSKQFFDILKANDKFKLANFINNSNVDFWLYTQEDENNGLHIAVMRDLNSIIKLLIETIEKRAPSDAFSIISEWINKPNIKGDTCLHYASYKGNYNLISLFSKFDIDAHVHNKQGNSVMHYAAQGNQPLPFIYFKQKYNLNAIEGNNDGSTPLHWACYTGSEIAFNFIVNYFDNLDYQDNDGLTALHLAVMSERTEIVKKLLQKGANKSIKDKKGRTPKELAEEKGKETIATMLEDKMVCSFFVMKNPIQKVERSNSNIYFFLTAHAITEFIFFSIVLPCKLRDLILILNALNIIFIIFKSLIAN